MAQKYLFIAISFYRNIMCKNIVCELGLNGKTETPDYLEDDELDNVISISLIFSHSKVAIKRE